ncbi:hypothetical protein BKI52_42310 [marine bacterium AO1-C]|nr:hypothetical protein BKI52_42310 [marine bacterium AO1-C]
MGNWKSILGIFIIMSALSECISTFKKYRSGALESWPWGLTLGMVGVVILGILLIKTGWKKKKI